MKALLVSSQYPPLEAGVPNFNYHISKMMTSKEFAVLTSNVPDSEKVDKKLAFNVYRHKFLTGYKLNFSPLFFLRHIPLLFYFIRIIRREKVDIVIQGEGRPFLMLLSYIAYKLFNVPYVVFHHGDGANPYSSRKSDVIVKFLIQKSLGVIANSEFTKERVIKKYSMDPEKIKILYPGVNTDFFTCGIDTTSLMNKHNLMNKKIIMTVGRLDKRKGHDHVIKSIPYLVKEIPNLIYLVIGNGDDKPRLESIINELQLHDYVLFTGSASLEDLPAYYNLCDLFVMPNREVDDGDTEGFGMVFIEANSCCKAEVAGYYGGAIEAVEDGVNGVFTDANDPEAIANTIIRLLTDNEMRTQLERKARERVMNNFTWETKQTKFKAILNTMLESK